MQMEEYNVSSSNFTLLKNGLSDFGNRFGGTFLSLTSTSSHILKTAMNLTTIDSNYSRMELSFTINHRI